MTKNMGRTDRTLRIIGALVLGAFISVGAVVGGLAIVCGIIAVGLAATSIMGYCPLYTPLHISTRTQHTKPV